jgi:hypothetical protein
VASTAQAPVADPPRATTRWECRSTPAQHEVVNVVDDSDAEPGTVVRVLRPGYGTAERQLRPGAVTVAGRRV